MTKKILIVDDSKVSRLFVMNFWQEFSADWQFYEAADGEQAIELAAKQQFDVIVLDFNMPDLNGLHVASRIKHQQPHCFMALLTANLQRYVQDEAEQAGLIYYRKPVTHELIKAMLSDAEEYLNALH